MRGVKAIRFVDDEIVAIDDAGDLWHAPWELRKEFGERVLNWRPLNGPPDGAHLQDRMRDRWERIEEEARRILEEDERLRERFEGPREDVPRSEDD
jgi:hypothetical protein